MREIYNEQYYRAGCGPIPYEDSKHWVPFFCQIADRIVADLHPATVLDAGCAMGYLVAALRDRGVEAYGVDLSKYAISHVREDVKPYCFAASLLEPLPEALPTRFDLVISIEVLEHLYPEEGAQVVQNLCGLTDTVLYSTSPDDLTERTHVNVQQREYWVGLFAQNGFLDDLLYRPTYITPHAVCCRRDQNILRQIQDYERALRQLESDTDKSSQAFISKVYYTFDQGESENECLTFHMKAGTRFSEKIDIPFGCRGLRFDPVELTGCLAWDIFARTEKESLTVHAVNGMEMDGVWFFADTDPQISISLPDGCRQVMLEAEIIPMSQKGWLMLYEAIQHREKTWKKEQDIEKEKWETMLFALKEQAEQEQEKSKQRVLEEIDRRESDRKELEAKITALEKELETRIPALEQEWETRLSALKEDNRLLKEESQQYEEALALEKEKTNRLQDQIADYSSLVEYERGDHRRQMDGINEELRRMTEAYTCISTSRIWRMSKPLRWFLDNLKRFMAKVKRKLSPSEGTPALPISSGTAMADQGLLLSKNTIPMTQNPIDPIQTILVPNGVKRLNLVTDSIDSHSLLGGVATALILATEFANRFDYELRIITRNTDVNPVNYNKILRLSGIDPARKLSFYSDYERKTAPVDYKLEITEQDVFFATSWWSAKAISETTIRKRFFYIIQEVETFFYNYGGERLLCAQMMHSQDIDYLVNSHYLFDYFRQHEKNIVENGVFFEPAFPASLYGKKTFREKDRYKLFFYSRPNNPRNLFAFGVAMLDSAVRRGILDTKKWEIFCVGQDTPEITFCDGTQPNHLGQLSWEEYSTFLSEVDLGLCLMYTPHPSYPPYDVACSGGVVLSNKMENKTSFDACGNVILADLEEEPFMEAFLQAVQLAMDMEQRRKNYEENTICRDWHESLKQTVEYMGDCTGDV